MRRPTAQDPMPDEDEDRRIRWLPWVTVAGAALGLLALFVTLWGIPKLIPDEKVTNPSANGAAAPLPTASLAGTVKPGDCRSFSVDYEQDGQRYPLYGTACLDEAGHWTLKE